MRIEHRFDVAAPADAVWSVLRDPESVAVCFPGAVLDERCDDGSYMGHITIRFGPTVASFSGRARIDIDDVAHTGAIEARGTDGRRSTRAVARAKVTLRPAGDCSAVEVIADVDVSGPLAGFAESGGRQVTRELLADFGRAVEDRITSPSGSQPAPRAELSALRLIGRITRRRIREMARGIADLVRRAFRRRNE
jgi:carbon monoxide dehydrogenase subunit G